MRIPNTIAAAAITAALAVTAACEQAVEANPELHNTRGGYGDSLSYSGADDEIDLPQSATIDSATARERATQPTRPPDPPDEEVGGH